MGGYCKPEYYAKRRYQFRIRIINLLGGKCVKCGFSDWRGLQIDHVRGGGTKHRKRCKNESAYNKEIEAGITSGDYQLLCANCNQIKRYERD